jgi:anti-sigma regulatory factor (Ser/Thr protein kinase)
MTVLDAVVADLSEQLVTCCYLIADPAREEVRLCSAGHLPALVVRPDGAVRPLAGPVNMPLGVARQAYRDARSELASGSTLVLYTDGLVESRAADIDAQLSLLTRELRGAAARELGLGETADAILSALLPTADGHRDDVTLFLIKMPQARLATASRQLAAEPRAAAAGRGFVAQVLASWDCGEVADTACLLASEIVTNAVQHAEGPLRLGLYRTASEVIVEVSDHSPGQPQLRPVDPTAEAGRGMLLVDALSDGWGTRLDGTDKTVWFALRLAGGAAACAAPARPRPAA